jgi:tape measure domain-containing protein
MAGKILKDDFAEVGAIAAFLKSTLDSLVAINDQISKIGGSVKGVNNLPASIKAQKDINALQKQQLINQKLLTQGEAAAANAVTARARAERANLSVLKEKANAEKAATMATTAQIRQQKLLEGQHKRTSSWMQNLTRSVLAYGAAMIGLQTIVNFFTKTLLNMTTKLNSLDYAMKTVIKSNKELYNTQKFLSKIAVNYGLDVLTLTERYIKFRAAAMQSNMTASGTMQIFNSVAKAAAVLGLRTDEVNGVFLALEQMISKGKVTTEELRRQLGERLPGAMGIMADAIGVSIVQLDKMLKAGTVLSSDALPKFADALEKAYGISAVNKVDTLAAAQGRLATAWVGFVKDVNAGSAYKTAIDGMATALGGVSVIMKGLVSTARKIPPIFGDIFNQATRSIPVLGQLGLKNYLK